MKSTIKNKNEIQELFEKGKTIKLNEVTIKFLKNNKNKNVFLFTRSKDSSNTAVLRNSINRKLKEISRKIKNYSLNIAMIGNKKILNIKNYEEISKIINDKLHEKIKQKTSLVEFIEKIIKKF